MLGNGDGTFAAPLTYGANAQPYGLAVADFNGDGKLDVALANQGTNSVSVLLGNGDGTFQNSYLYAAGLSPEAIAAGDLNGDGKIDLATANSDSNDVSILLGNGDGTFVGAREFQSPISASLLTADLNHDGKLDAVLDYGVMLGNGDGTFQSPIPGVPGVGVAVADFNNDGNLDLAGGTDISPDWAISLSQSCWATVTAPFNRQHTSAHISGPDRLLAAD